MNQMYIKIFLKRFFPEKNINYGMINYILRKESLTNSDFDYIQQTFTENKNLS